MRAFRETLLQIFVVIAALLLTACGGGSSGGSGDDSSGGGSSSGSTPGAPTVTVSYGPKQVILTWAAVSDATYYQVSKNAGASGYSSLGDSLTTTTYTDTVAVHLTDWINASYKVSACNTQGCTDSAAIYAVSIQAIGYFKASNTAANDYFGRTVALSADGNTLAVGAVAEDSAATGVGGDQGNNDVINSGAVYVFTRSDAIWTQEAYVKASNTEEDDSFGSAVALSDDGNTLTVGAPGEDSSATGVNDENVNAAVDSGAVYVFTRSGTTWTQQAYVKASNTGAGDSFGIAVALSADGNTLAVGADEENSAATGVGGDQGSGASDSGAVYVFTRSDIIWTQEAYVKASNTAVSDYFGTAVALSADGNTLAVGADEEDSDATGVGGDQANGADDSGAVYVFTRSDAIWTQEAYVKASNTDGGDYFGTAVALSADGNTLAVGADEEDSDATGVNGDQGSGAVNSGAVYVFTRSDAIWTQEAYVKASNTGGGDYFGTAVALSADGNTLAVGAGQEDSNATGVNGDQGDNDAESGNSGAVYAFTRSDTTWTQQGYVKASNTATNDYFGRGAVALSADGNTLAAGARSEDSSATGVGGDQEDNSAGSSGAVYLY